MKYARETLFFSVMAVFVGTALVTLCGVTGALTIQARYLNVLFSALIIELVGTVVGLFKATDWFGKALSSSRAEVVEGWWWQFIRYEQKNAISFVQIHYSSDQEQLLVEGEAYTEGGGPFSRWWSVGTSLNAATLELRYFWKGDQELTDDDLSGVGCFRFTRVGKASRPNEGTGWFVSGNIDQLNVTQKQKVELQLASRTDSKTMLSGSRWAKGQLASQVYSNWKMTLRDSEHAAESIQDTEM